MLLLRAVCMVWYGHGFIGPSSRERMWVWPPRTHFVESGCIWPRARARTHTSTWWMACGEVLSVLFFLFLLDSFDFKHLINWRERERERDGIESNWMLVWYVCIYVCVYVFMYVWYVCMYLCLCCKKWRAMMMDADWMRKNASSPTHVN